MLEMKTIFKQEKIMLQLTFIPGLTLIGFQTTLARRPKLKEGVAKTAHAQMVTGVLVRNFEKNPLHVGVPTNVCHH